MGCSDGWGLLELLSVQSRSPVVPRKWLIPFHQWTVPLVKSYRPLQGRLGGRFTVWIFMALPWGDPPSPSFKRSCGYISWLKRGNWWGAVDWEGEQRRGPRGTRNLWRAVGYVPFFGCGSDLTGVHALELTKVYTLCVGNSLCVSFTWIKLLHFSKHTNYRTD